MDVIYIAAVSNTGEWTSPLPPPFAYCPFFKLLFNLWEESGRVYMCGRGNNGKDGKCKGGRRTYKSDICWDFFDTSWDWFGMEYLDRANHGENELIFLFIYLFRFTIPLVSSSLHKRTFLLLRTLETS